MNVTIDRATKHFGDVRALNDVSLDIRSGELFFMLGPSGCGKTTLLRAIAGLENIDSGRILFDGEDVADTPAHKRNTAMVFQGYALWPHMTVAQNVAFGLEVRNLPGAERGRRVNRALERVQIGALSARKPHELSGGQQQRVALARTLVVEPQCLLLDEPLANLDAKLRRDMRSEIRRICKETGLTAIYVTHDRQEALSMADRLAVLRHGDLLQVGTPREVYTRPINTFVAGFIGETNFIEAVLRERAGNDVTLDTPVAQLTSRGTAGKLEPGQKVTVSLRPEVLRMTRGQAEGSDCNRITAQLVQTTYLGEIAEHTVGLTESLTFTLFELNPRTEYAVGETVSLSVLPEDVVVLTDT